MGVHNKMVIKDVSQCVEEEDCRTDLVIEVYLPLITLLIAFLTVFGSWRRRSHSSMLKYSIWTSYFLCTYLINYTMGVFTTEDYSDDIIIAIWAMFLLIFVGSADCISAYSLEDNENRKRYNLEILILYFWVGWLLGNNTKKKKEHVLLYVLFAWSLIRTVARSKAWALASKSYGLARNAKLIADFMEDDSKEDDPDPTCMKGYKYLVKAEKKAKVTVKAPCCHTQSDTTDDLEVVTIDMIWQCKGRLLSSTGDRNGQLKDVCLSYALYRLLCRRFANYPFSERFQEKTWKFVRDGLLSNSKEGDDHERAFRVIEVELAFLYDHLYTKYPVFFAKGLPLFRNLEFFMVIIGCWAVALNLKPESGPAALLTIIVIVTMLFLEVVQIFVINFSNWAKVQWLCHYVKKPSWQNNKPIEMIIKIMCHRKGLKPWDRKLSQYSLLESFNHNPCALLHNSLTSLLIDIERKGQKQSAHTTLTVEVKKAVIHSLKTNEKKLTNGSTSLRLNDVEGKLSWACRMKKQTQTQTHVIMIWHIATSLCELNLSSQVIKTGEQANQQRKSNDFIVATKLSKYCAYLVAFAPRLLPDPAYTTEIIFDQVVVEARNKFKGCKKGTCKDNRMKNICEKMLTSGEDSHEGTEEIIEKGAILEKGAVLAKHLLKEIKDNGLRWKLLAELWAEMMLFVAPSDDETAHAEHLTMGGEFVTHLWALLSHAGILERDSAPDV